MLRNFVTNPETGRAIRINGPTYNRLIVEAYDLLDGRLVRRATAGSPPAPPPQYLNIMSGRLVREGSRTFQYLMGEEAYEIVGDYLIPPDLVDAARLEIQESQPFMNYHYLSEWREDDQALSALRQDPSSAPQEQERIQRAQDVMDTIHAAIDAGNEIMRERQQEREHLMMNRLAELNIALCSECQMPIKAGDVKCEECAAE